MSGARTLTVVGLTGSIGMGKSTAAQILRGMGLPIYSADKAVHELLRADGAGVGPVARAFPESLRRDAIDRAVLGRSVFGCPQRLERLERIVHPLLRRAERAFLAEARAAMRAGGPRAAILEIPLLFETGGEARCDIVLCVTAPRRVQTNRVLARPGMDKDRLKAIRARQMPDADKRRRADYVIRTGDGMAATEAQLRQLFGRLGLLDP